MVVLAQRVVREPRQRSAVAERREERAPLAERTVAPQLPDRLNFERLAATLGAGPAPAALRAGRHQVELEIVPGGGAAAAVQPCSRRRWVPGRLVCACVCVRAVRGPGVARVRTPYSAW
eukprot:3396367-Prymnesium_polylepis.1